MRSAGEHHRYNPQTIHLLQESTKTGNYQMFKQYTDMVKPGGDRLHPKHYGL